MINPHSTAKTISIIGGGPGGLFLAILLRQQRPDWVLRVWERNPPDATFGFGVVFSDRTVELLDKADPESLALIRDDFQSWTDIEVGSWNGVRRTSGHGFSAIARHRLLAILQQRARDLGIEVAYETEAPDLDELYNSSDVIVGADGINSRVRTHWESEFQPDVRMGRARFIWFATPRRYDALTFHFVQTPYGPFSTHAYPFSEDLSTFIVEADEQTWRNAGLDRQGLPDLAVGETDEAAMKFCEEIFAESLQGQPLVGNASYWRQFPTVRNASWCAGNKAVIIGDAAHTAHFSVGSGTKMAMEDAAALARALIDFDDPSEALKDYERTRKASVEKIQHLAEPSRGWWENFQWWVDRDLDAMTVNFLTRTGRETVDHLRQRDAEFAEKVVDDSAVDEAIALGSNLALTNRLGLSFDADSTMRQRELDGLGALSPLPGFLHLPKGQASFAPMIRAALGDQSPPIFADSDATEVHSEGVDLWILPPGSTSAKPFATAITTPTSIDDTAGWDEVVELARAAEKGGAQFIVINAASSNYDRRALVTHAGVILRPRIGLPIVIGDCSSRQEALTHLNSDRADMAIGRVGSGYFDDLHRQLGLQALTNPRSVVVVGASQDETKAGNALLKNLRAFPGSVFGLGRTPGKAHGREIVSSLRDIHDTVDLAVIAVPGPAVPGALEDLARSGIRAAVICSGGFAETDSGEGHTLQAAVDKIQQRYGIRILGPNTSGLAVPTLKLYASFVPAVTEIEAGPVAVLAQSGGVAHAAALALNTEGVGVSSMVGTGNACDIDLAELIKHAAEEGRCSAIAVHLEGTSDGHRLLEAIRVASVKVPVVVLKSGVSDVDRLAASHTGALTGDWQLAHSLLTEAGAVVVSTLGDLVDSVSVLSLTRLPTTPSTSGVGVVTGQAGPGILLTDRLQTLGADVPALASSTEARLHDLLPALTHRQNPVDTGRPGDNFVEVVTAVANDASISVLAIYVLLEPDAVDLVASMKEARDRFDTPIVVSSNGLPAEIIPVRNELRSCGIQLLANPERAARGAWALISDCKSSALREASRGGRSARTNTTLAPAPETEFEAKSVLAQAGFTIPESRLCSDRSGAQTALRELTEKCASVVVKISSREVGHKSTVGGVHLNVGTPQDMDRALTAIDAIARKDSGYLVEQQVGGGDDLFISVRHDDSWGSVGLLGHGGTDVEENGDVEMFSLPTNEAALRYRVERLIGRDIHDAQPLLDLYEFMDNALRTWEGRRSFEINPLRLTNSGPIALDALIAAD